MNPQAYYESLQQIDYGFGALFLSTALLTISIGYGWRVPFIQRLTIKSLWLYPPALIWTLMEQIYKMVNVSHYLHGTEPRPKFWRYLIPIAIISRIPGLFNSFWYDETWTGSIAQLPLSSLPNVIMADVHPPIPYFISWLFGRVFGSSEIALRTPSMILGVFAVFLIYRYTKSLRLDQTTAQVSAWITALLPASIFYSNESRGYMLLTVLVLVALIAINEKRRNLFIVSAGALGWIHAYGFIYLSVLGLVSLIAHPQKRWFKTVLKAGIISGLWFPFMLIQSGDVSNGFWIEAVNVPQIARYVVEMTIGFRIEPQVVLFAFVPTMSISLSSLYICRDWLLSKRGFALVAVAMGVPVVAGIISAIWNPIYLQRALLPSAVLFVPLWAYTLTKASFNVRSLYRYTFIPALLIAFLSGFMPSSQRFELRQAFEQCEGTAGLYATSSAIGVSALYYSPVPVTLWTDANDLNQFISEDGKRGFGFEQGTIEDISGQTICMVVQYTPYTTHDEIQHVKAILNAHAHETIRIINIDFYRINVYIVK